MAEKIQKIYDLQEIGGEHIITTLDQINKKFAEIRRTKVALNSQAFKESINGETEASKKLLAQLQALTVKELELKTKRQEIINQSKEIQLLRQQELLQQRQAVSGNNVLAGSYNAIAKQYRELQQVVKATPEGKRVTLADGTVLSYQKAIDKLKELAAREQAYRRQFTQDGTLVGEYKSGILSAFKDAGLTDLIQNQLTQAKTKVKELDAQFEKLTLELREVQRTGRGSMDSLEQQLIENRNAASQLNSQINTLDQGLRGAGGVGSQIVNALKENFKDLGKQIAQVVVGYLGFQVLMTGLRTSVDNAKSLSDVTSDLQIELGRGADAAGDLVDKLAGLDTRTKLGGLESISVTASKAGTTADNLFKVTEAIDKTSVAFGKDFGSIEEGTETFAKLINIFYDDREITGERILFIGNAIRTLANETVASVPFINDFNGRMAGLKQLFKNFDLSQSIGLAAGFEEFKQSAEVSSTVLVKVLPKLAADTEKYSAIIGKTNEEFKDLINNNPVEALLQVSQALVNTEGGVEEIAKALGDAELGSGRITTILATLGGKADVFRERITRAGEAIKSTDNVTAAFNEKNENLAGTMDKVSKKFADAASNKAFQITLLALATTLSFLISILPVLIGLLTTYGVIWGVANAEMIKAKAILLLTNLAYKAQYAWLLITNTTTQAYTATLVYFTNKQKLATLAAQLFNIALRENPIGIVLTLVAALAAALVVFGGVLFDSTDKVKAHTQAMRIQAEITKMANEATAEQVNKLNILVAVARDVKNSDDTRKQSIKDLIALYPAFNQALNGEVISLQGLNKAYKEVTKSIRLMAEVQASASLSTEKQKAVLEVTALRQKLEIESTGKTGSTQIKGLTKEEEDILFSSPSTTSLRGNGSGTISFLASDRDAIINKLKQIEASRTEAYKQYMTAAAKKQVELTNFEKANQDKVDKAVEGNVDVTVGARRDYLKKQIDKLAADYELLRITDQAGREKNEKERQKYQKELDELNTKKNGKPERERAYGGAKLTGETKDLLKAADTETALLKAQLEKRKLDGKILEADYYVELNEITQKGITAKLNIIKDGNAEEKKQRAELVLESVKSTQDMNDELLKIEEKRLTKEFESNKKKAENALRLVTDDANATDLQKAQAQLEFDQKMIDEQINYGDQMDALEKKLNVTSVDNAQKRADDLLEIKRKEVTDQTEFNKKVYDALFKALDDSDRDQTTKANTSYFNDLADLNSERFNNEDRRKRKLEELERKHQQTILEIQRAGINARLLAEEYMHAGGYTSEKEYNEKILELQRQLAENTASVNDNTQKGIMASWDNFKASLGEFLKVAQDVYQQVIQPLFDLQSQKIDNEQKETEAQQEEAKKRELAKATTEAEKQKIEDKYANIKEQNDKKFAEQRKKIALKELAIESGLAAIKALLSLPNYIQVALNLGLVAANYAIQKSKIEATSFEKGGSLKSVLSRGGRFNGPSHRNGGIPFSFGGSPVEVEGDEGFVVNKKSMNSNRKMTVTGTPAQIASASNVAGGGYNFAPGAQIMRYEYGGNLGMSLKAPVIIPRFTSSGTTDSFDTSKIYELIMAQTIALQSVNERIDKVSVILNPNDVTNYQTKQSKAVDLSTL